MPAANLLPNFAGFVVDRRYKLTKQLGSGSFGVVYQAIDLLAQSEVTSQVAIKIMRTAGRNAAEADVLRQETIHHALMSGHPNVLTLHDAFEDKEYVYLVLDLCTGGDLFEQIVEKKAYAFNDKLLRKAFLQIIDAVQACHTKGLYHRDLKPENILTNEDGSEIFLCDFGLATNRKISRQCGLGTSTYISPECIGASTKRVAFCNRANDVWALGIILVNMIGGRHPWMKAVREDECFAAFTSEPGFLRGQLPLSRRADVLIHRILEPDPRKRITLPRLRAAVLGIDTFFMSADELARSNTLEDFAEDAPPPAAAGADRETAVDTADALGLVDEFCPETPRQADSLQWVERRAASIAATTCSESSEESSIGPVTPEASVMQQEVVDPPGENEIEEVAREPVKRSPWAPLVHLFAWRT